MAGQGHSSFGLGQGALALAGHSQHAKHEGKVSPWQHSQHHQGRGGGNTFPCCTSWQSLAPSSLAFGSGGEPTAAGTRPSSCTARNSPLRNSWLAGKANLPPAQRSLAGPGFVLQLQPVLAQFRAEFGTQETQVASETGRSREKRHGASEAHQVR